MTFHLRDYQIEMIDEARAALRSHRSVLLQLPTGGGKTAIAAHMLRSAGERDLRSWFICNRRELVEQTAREFAKQDIQIGFCAAGFPWLPAAKTVICSVDTLRHRHWRLTPPALVVWDEAHHVAAKTWAKLHESLDARHIGLTATPERLDGKGLRDNFDALVIGPTTLDLIEAGYLSDYDVFAPRSPDLAGVKTQAGDYNRKQLASVMDSRTIIGDAVAHYMRLAPGNRAVVFAVSVDHSKHIAETFRAAGIAAAHIDAKTHVADRRQIVEAFRAGEIKVLSNVGLIGEGFDLPAIEVAILLRPTQSLAWYLQMVGRALRPAPGKTKAIILDHAGNTERHGLPCAEREWSLDGQARKAAQEGAGGTKRCPKCYHIHRPGPTSCPACGFVYPKATVEEIEVVEEDLVEVDKTVARQAAKAEQAQAQTLDDLVALGAKRGYKSPERWAAHVYTARQRKRATA